MNETKFTPGPWASEYDGHGGIYIGCDKHQIGFVSNRGPQEANAALIAAAPELYERLAFLIDCLETNDYGRAQRAIPSAKAVLEGARGEQ